MNYLQKLSRADIQSFSRGLGFANPLVDKPTMLSQLTKQLLSLRISGAHDDPKDGAAMYGNRRFGPW